MPGLDEDAAGRRLDQQAVERLGEAPVLVQLALGPRAPQDPGHGPEQRPGVGLEACPAWMSATRVPPPRSALQWTASLMPTAQASLADLAAALEVGVERRRGGLGLALVLRAELLGAVRPLHRRAHPEEADLADPHPVVEGDRQVGDVRELERQRPLPARVHVAGRRVDEQAEAAQRATSPRASPRGRRAAPPTPASGRARTRPGGG